MVAEYGESEFVTTHHMHRKRMRAQQMPPDQGWYIWIGHFTRKEWPAYWEASPFLVLPDNHAVKRSSRRATYYNSHSRTQVVSQLFIQIVRSPMRRFCRMWRFSLPRGKCLYRIWPPTSYSFPWPSGSLDDYDADYISHAVPDFLHRGQVGRMRGGRRRQYPVLLA
jgi:hypothetical protein